MVGSLGRNRSGLTLATINLRFSLAINRKCRQTADFLRKSSKGRSPAGSTNFRVAGLQGAHKASGWASRRETGYRRREEDGAGPWSPQTSGDREAKGEPGGDTEGMIGEAGKNSLTVRWGNRKSLKKEQVNCLKCTPSLKMTRGDHRGWTRRESPAGLPRTGQVGSDVRCPIGTTSSAASRSENWSPSSSEWEQTPSQAWEGTVRKQMGDGRISSLRTTFYGVRHQRGMAKRDTELVRKF